MKIGSPEWKQRERTWLLFDIQFQLGIIEQWKELGLDELVEIDQRILKEKRRQLKLLREGVAYERQFKEEVVS